MKNNFFSPSNRTNLTRTNLIRQVCKIPQARQAPQMSHAFQTLETPETLETLETLEWCRGLSWVLFLLLLIAERGLSAEVKGPSESAQPQLHQELNQKSDPEPGQQDRPQISHQADDSEGGKKAVDKQEELSAPCRPRDGTIQRKVWDHLGVAFGSPGLWSGRVGFQSTGWLQGLIQVEFSRQSISVNRSRGTVDILRVDIQKRLQGGALSSVLQPYTFLGLSYFQGISTFDRQPFGFVAPEAGLGLVLPIRGRWSMVGEAGALFPLETYRHFEYIGLIMNLGFRWSWSSVGTEGS